MILVLGATGHTGSAAAGQLAARGVAVRAVTRDPEKASRLPALAGVSLVQGDTSDPRSLVRHFEGVTKVYLVPPTERGWDEMQSAIISDAASAGVEHMVKLSAMGAGPDEPSMSLTYHWRGEQEIEASGMVFTHIRPNSFFQNTLFDVASLKIDGRFYSCVGEARFAKLDTRDIAEAVVAVLTEGGHDGRTYELTGAESLSYPDLADRLTTALGTAVEYVDLSPEDYADLLEQSGLPDWMAAEFSDIYGRGFYREGGGARITETLERLLARPARTFSAFALENRDSFRRSSQA